MNIKFKINLKFNIVVNPQRSTPHSACATLISHDDLLASAQHQSSTFSHTEMWLGSSAVSDARSQLVQRSRSRIPASRAMRSSSEGQTYRKGLEKVFVSPSRNQEWCDHFVREQLGPELAVVSGHGHRLRPPVGRPTEASRL